MTVLPLTVSENITVVSYLGEDGRVFHTQLQVHYSLSISLLVCCCYCCCYFFFFVSFGGVAEQREECVCVVVLKMKRCELCKLTARMYCDSDQASLCWDCDAKVHSANFLVARHSRSLLCHVCQSPTPWNASGAKLGPTVSVCEACVGGCEGVKESRAPEEESEGGNDADLDTDDEYDDDDDGDEDEGEDDEGVSGDDVAGDNQVVPWSSTPPPPPSSSPSSEESSSRFCNSDGAVSLKRLRVNAADLLSNDDHGCSSCHRNTCSAAVLSARDSEAGFGHSLRPLKRRRDEANRSNRSAGVHVEPAGSRTAGIVESLKRLHQEDLSSGYNASAAIVGICKLTQNRGTVDLDSAKSASSSDLRLSNP